VGGREPVQVDVRLIAATNQRLDEMVTTGRFREDLLYRLNGITITLPPLRDRPDDIPKLVAHFIRLTNEKLGKSVQSATPEAMTRFVQHGWPGNVRELQNAVRYAVIRTLGDVLTPDCLPESLLPNRTGAAAPVELADLRALVRALLTAGDADIYRRVIHEVDRVILAEALGFVDGNQVHASELLGISRTTLRAKLTS